MSGRESEGKAEYEPEMSLIIPTFNEAARIEPTLASIERFTRTYRREMEILIVDDGSRDATVSKVERFASQFSGRLELLQLAHRGKGHAVRHGMLAARGRILVFCDADLSTPLEELDNLLAPILRGEQDIVIGSRAVDRNLVRKRQALLRESLGKTFNLVVRGLLDLPFGDTQCGFKAFRREIAREIFSLQRVDGFAFDAEVLLIALGQGRRVKEIGVEWSNSEDSRVHVILAPLEMLRDTLRVLVYRNRGRYRTNQPVGSRR